MRQLFPRSSRKSAITLSSSTVRTSSNIRSGTVVAKAALFASAASPPDCAAAWACKSEQQTATRQAVDRD